MTASAAIDNTTTGNNNTNASTGLSPVRKRRRKNTNTGADSDCFSCRKRGTACDRVRPFCGQCLQRNEECGGYKTVLTWGVGVASRGKLRGLSLPVQNSQAVSQSSPTSASPKTPIGSTNKQKRQNSQDSKENDTQPNKRQRSSSFKSWNEAQYSPQLPRYGNPIPQQPMPWGWQPVSAPPTDPKFIQSPTQAQMYHFPQPHPPSAAPQRLYTSGDGTGNVHALPTPPGSTISNNSAIPYADGSHESAGNFKMSPEDMSFTNPFAQRSDDPDFKAPGQRPILNNFARHPPYPSLQPIESYPQSSPQLNIPSSYPTDDTSTHDNQWETTTPDIAYPQSATSVVSPSFMGFENLETAIADEPTFSQIGENMALSIPRFPSTVSIPHMSGRMQSLLNYYDLNICPVLVAEDSPSNPYRAHIMHLAMQNEGLQNAMAALVTNNMRMRDMKQRPRLIDAETSTASNRKQSQDLVLTNATPTPEEQHYKAKSIELLNQQLSRSAGVCDDSVLATLLILCLFHVCDSGFSKFKTQLAGVQKLLRMRNKSVQNDFISWVEMFFAWFDVMTAAVNDRESQIRSDSLDMLNFSSNLGALEQFSGCDGRLFKLIARLGRLNLLSQNRPVQDEPSNLPSPPNGRVETLDENEAGKELLSSASDGPNTNTELDESEEHRDDGREAFWKEYWNIRRRLKLWKMDRSGYGSDENTPLSLPQQNLVDISEAFRYSALLYLERLANPALPSLDERFQNFVRQSLHYIEQIGVNSCVTKFMLWPLFITGTECVEERHRNLIRERCIEIQEESGFYNNLNGLQVLERVWKDGDADGSKPAVNGQAFSWRKAMDRVDGEYIVL